MGQQKLVTEIQNMFKSMKKDDEKDKYFYFSPKYSPKVKITDWFLPEEANPKDNDPYHPPGGNYFVSTYRRLGTEDVTELETTTQAMLRQICSPPAPPSPYRPMVNAATTDIIRIRKEDLIECKGASSTEHDFTTTYTYDYRHPFPHRRAVTYKTQVQLGAPKKNSYMKLFRADVRRAIILNLQEKPQKRFGLASQFNKSKICETKFLDDGFYSKPTRSGAVSC